MARTKDAKIQLLSSVPLFSACSRAELARIAALADYVEIPAGKTMTEEGLPGEEAFVIASGTAEATLRGEPVATFDAGQIVGEMSLLDKGPRSATVVAVTDLEVLVLDSRGFYSLLREAPSVAIKILQSLTERLRRTENAPHY